MFAKGVSKPIHVDCYKSRFGRTPTGGGRPSKFPSRCVQCGERIDTGVMITFLRVRGHGNNAPVESEASEATETSDTAVEAAPAPIAATTAPAATDGVAAALAAVLLPGVTAEVTRQVEAKLAGFDAASIVAEADAAIAARIEAINVPREVVVVKVDGSKVNVGLQHKLFDDLLVAVSAGVNVWIAGPAGSGKTTAAENVAKALGRPFYLTGAVGDQYALLGYNDANGRYVRTAFREAFENGGVFLWDEVDASDPTALLAFQAALANGVMAFPDGMVKRHADCFIIAAANTWGHGATHEYVGRLKLDAAFLDRFGCRIAWDYDSDLEKATCANAAWVRRVQAIRAAVRAKGIRVLVTPRASYQGARLLAAGMPQDKVEAYSLRSGMTDEQWTSVLAACPRTESAEPAPELTEVAAQ